MSILSRFLRSLFYTKPSAKESMVALRVAAENAKNRGNAYLFQGEFDQAVECYQEALRIFPDYAEANVNLGCMYKEKGYYSEAEFFLGKAVALEPKLWQAHFNLGLVAEKLGKFEQALTCYENVLAIPPSTTETYPWPEVHWRMMEVFVEQERYKEALEVINTVTEAHSAWIKARGLREIALSELGRNQNAIKQLNYLEVMQEHPLSLRFLGSFYQERQNWAQAMDCYTQACEMNPNDSESRMTQAQLSLLLGDYENGWNQFGAALTGLGAQDIQLTDAQRFRKKFTPDKYWQGDDLQGRTLLVWTEQGIGDSLMMFRYLERIREHYPTVRIFVLCEQPLQRIVQNFSMVEEAIVKPGESVNTSQFDYHCSVMSLPCIIKTRLDTIPNTVPYIFVPEENQLKWAERLAALSGAKVGLVWGGNKLYPNDKQRSIPLEKFAPFLELSGIAWISLQKGEYAKQLKELAWPIIDWTEELQDMQDTAALVASLDLVISVDTSVIHLVGALGRPAWLLNRYGSEWRWLLERENSPWYPSVRIFRQMTPYDWDSVIARMVTELKTLMNQEG